MGDPVWSPALPEQQLIQGRADHPSEKSLRQCWTRCAYPSHDMQTLGATGVVARKTILVSGQ